MRKKDKERKKFAREYEKYLCPEKYNKRLERDRVRSREYRAKKQAEAEMKEQNNHHLRRHLKIFVNLHPHHHYHKQVRSHQNNHL